MARSAKLKVYRTPIGFHDAYVAAPSQKAALEAWGSDANLFARGVAEIVTDAALAEEPLAKPGVVIRRLRGTADEQIAAASEGERARSAGAKPARGRKADSSPAEAKPTTKPPTKAPTEPTRTSKARPEPKHRPKPKPKLKPRPDRTALDAAEDALVRAEERQRGEAKALADQIAAFTRRREALRKAHAAETGKLERARDRARAAYDRALDKWRG